MMNPDNDYGTRLQNILDTVIASGADQILSDGDELVMDVDDESIVISRINGRISVRILGMQSSSGLDEASD
ncbi:MAG: hypothetical protein K9W43_03520 [Candidatus Thorarchaeota archaeon]|nr:hypothetical protein [Candidatus Thorarchaeota archaeon]